MKELRGRIAVVTGGASGIGLGLARQLGAEGMRVVIADVRAEALESAAAELAGRGVETLAVETDVTVAESVESLARETLEHFGAVHVVCNNAGVFAGGLSWETPLEDWEWILRVNLWGVIHGIRTFVPILLEQGGEGHVVNTASMAAVTSVPFTGAYYASKHAVLSLSETLYHELTLRPSPIGVSALCPELVNTRIDGCERTRPAELRVEHAPSPERELVEKSIREGIRDGTDPDAIGRRTVEAIREGRFYVLPEEGDAWRRAAASRCDDVRLARNPTFVPPMDT